jgi:hypothetical protein
MDGSLVKNLVGRVDEGMRCLVGQLDEGMRHLVGQLGKPPEHTHMRGWLNLEKGGVDTWVGPTLQRGKTQVSHRFTKEIIHLDIQRIKE